MKSSHAWVGSSAQRWVLNWIPATKTECTWFFLICCGNRNKIWRDGPGCPNTWIWARLGSSFLIFILSNPVLQRQGELSTLYQCGQQSLKYLLSGPFQKKKKKKSLLTIAGGRKAEWIDLMNLSLINSPERSWHRDDFPKIHQECKLCKECLLLELASESGRPH